MEHRVLMLGTKQAYWHPSFQDQPVKGFTAVGGCGVVEGHAAVIGGPHHIRPQLLHQHL